MSPSQSFSDAHPPSFAYLDPDIGPIWTVVWVWPEKTVVGGPLTRHCPHRHRSSEAAVRCAMTRCVEVRT